MARRLAEKIAVVTGGTTGIGLARRSTPAASASSSPTSATAR
jgi:NADP-dependent 3-hydroxy acid dehydrogenase YdfG